MNQVFSLSLCSVMIYINLFGFLLNSIILALVDVFYSF